MQNKVNTGYLCFLIIAKYLGVKVPKEYEEKFQDLENTEYKLLRLAKDLKMKVKAGKTTIKKMVNITVPVIAEKKDGEYFIILTHQNRKWSVLDPIKGIPEVIDEEELCDKISGHIIILGKKDSPE